jgi:hypothetical protein
VAESEELEQQALGTRIEAEGQKGKEDSRFPQDIATFHQSKRSDDDAAAAC